MSGHFFWCRVILSTGAKSHVFSSGASYHPVPNHLSFIGPGQWYRPVLILNHLYRIVLNPVPKVLSRNLEPSVQAKSTDCNCNRY